jgi:hypothetical protein
MEPPMSDVIVTHDRLTKAYLFVLELALLDRTNAGLCHSALVFARDLRQHYSLLPDRRERALAEILRSVPQPNRLDRADRELAEAFLCLNPFAHSRPGLQKIIRRSVAMSLATITGIRQQRRARHHNTGLRGNVGFGPAKPIDPDTGKFYWETDECQHAGHNDTVFYIFHAMVWARRRYCDFLQYYSHLACPFTRTTQRDLVRGHYGDHNLYLELACEYLARADALNRECNMPMPSAANPRDTSADHIGASVAEACRAAGMPSPGSKHRGPRPRSMLTPPVEPLPEPPAGTDYDAIRAALDQIDPDDA